MKKENYWQRRIEDFIAFAKEGKDVHAEIALKRHLLNRKFVQELHEDMKCEIDMYLFIGDYTFRIGKEVNHVCKVYMYGYLKEHRRCLLGKHKYR